MGAVFSQATRIVVSSSLLIHGPHVSLIKFLGSCAQTSCKLTAHLPSLSLLPSLLHVNIQPAYSLLLYLL